MANIIVKYGTYRNTPVVDKSFTLVKGFQTGKKGNFITVKNEGQFANNIGVVRIKVADINDIEFSSGPVMAETKTVTKPKVEETDEEAMNRIATRFEILDDMAVACIKGGIRAMIVSGPPGVGKSYGVEQQLEKASLFDRLAGNRVRFEIVKGAMTSLGLYAQLYKFSDASNVLVFDDCDSIFADELSLNILKAALDSGKRRRICWNSDSALLRREGIPDSFDFKGGAIFITNLKFSNVRSKKLQDHLEALESRCHFLDLTIDSHRDKMLRIRQVHRDANNGLFADYGFTAEQAEEIFTFMEEKKDKLREMSMRMALKIADLTKINTNWRSLAENTVMKRD